MSKATKGVLMAAMVAAVVVSTPGCGKRSQGNQGLDRKIAPDQNQAPPPLWNNIWDRLRSRKITDEDLKLSMSIIPPEARVAIETPQGKQKLIDELTRRRVITLWALDNGLLEVPEAQWNAAFAVEEILTQIVFAREIESKVQVSDEEVKSVYDNNPNRYAEWRYSRILVAFAPDSKPEDQDRLLNMVMAMRERIERGEDFDAMAKSASQDRQSAQRGGEMSGWFAPDSMNLDPNIRASLQEMTVGEVRGPIRSLEGYNIIRLDESRPKPFEGIREKLRADLRREKIKKAENDFVGELMKTYPVSVPSATEKSETKTGK